MRTLLSRTGFRRLLVGQGVSALGDWMGTFAFIALVAHVTGSSTAVAGILVLRLLPAALAGPFSARLVHRWDRRRTMLAMDAARAAMIAVIPFVTALWWIYLWAFLIELASLAFLPARDSSIPDLAGDDDLTLADGLVLGSSYGTIPVGAALFAGLAAISIGDLGGPESNYALVWWIDAATYVVSFLFISRLTELREPDEEDMRPAGLRGSVQEHPGGAASAPSFRQAFRIPLVAAVMPSTAGVALGLGALFSLGIVFVRETLSASDAEFGVLCALFGVGAGAGLGLLRATGIQGIGAVRLGVALQGAVIAVMSLAPNVPVAFLGAVAFGGATTVALTSGMSILQERLDGRERVLAFAAFHVVIRFGLSLAAISAGISADVLDEVQWPVVGEIPSPRLVLFCSGIVVLISSRFVHGTSAAADGTSS